jgi:integrase
MPRGKWTIEKFIAVLLGGDSGLRRGEFLALRQTDVDHRPSDDPRAALRLERVEDVPKGGRGRLVPMTEALAKALSENLHLGGHRVLHQDDGSPVDANVLQDWMEEITRRAGLEPTRSLHVLRHMFAPRHPWRFAQSHPGPGRPSKP